MNSPNLGIYAITAPAYLKKNIPVIPLRVKSKIPVPDGWSDWAEHELTDALKQNWLELPDNHNIGLVLGPKSGVSVLDIDIEDEFMVQRLIDLLPVSLWHRKGKKGMVLAYKFNPNIKKAFRLKDKNGKTLVEFLNNKLQVVLPPSVHPDSNPETGGPIIYTANCDLLQAMKSPNFLPVPDNFEEMVRAILTSLNYELQSKERYGGLTEFVPAGGRDNAMTSRAGALAIDVVRGFLTLKRAIETLQVLESSFTQQVEGDPMDLHKHVSNLINFIKQDLVARSCKLPIGWDKDLTEKEIKAYGMFDVETEKTYEEMGRQAFGDLDNQGGEVTVDTVRLVLQELATVRTIDPLKEKVLLETILRRTKHLNLGVKDLKKELNRFRAMAINVEIAESGSILELSSHTQVARAVLSYQKRFGDLRSQDGILHQWRGSHWEVVDQPQMMEFVSNRYIECPVMKRNSDSTGVWREMLILANGRIRTDFRPCINVANGAVLGDGTLVDHDPEFGATYVLPYRYAEGAQCPLFLRFLEDCWGNDPDYSEKLIALQQALCATLLGYAPRFQRAFLLIGKAKTGKSVLLKIIGGLFPLEARASVSFSQLQDGNMLVSLDNKLINVVGELSEKQRIRGDLFKGLIDGSSVMVRRLYKEAFNMTPVCAHWAASNHLPRTDDSSQGFTRRWLMFKFGQVIADERVDVNLADHILREEREGVFAWALKALPTLVCDNADYTLPSSHKALVNRLTHTTNPVLYFLEKDPYLQFDPAHEISEEALWYQFKAFFTAAVGGRNQHDMSSFRGMLEEVMSEFGVKPLHKGSDVRTYYSGIKILE